MFGLFFLEIVVIFQVRLVVRVDVLILFVRLWVVIKMLCVLGVFFFRLIDCVGLVV